LISYAEAKWICNLFWKAFFCHLNPEKADATANKDNLEELINNLDIKKVSP